MKQHRYIMELKTSRLEGSPVFKYRSIDGSDLVELGELLYQADLGTVDDEGLPVENSIKEIQKTLDGEYGKFLNSCSFLAIDDEKIVAACLVTYYEKENEPLVAYTMTHPQFKNQRFCQNLLAVCSDRLFRIGYSTCFLAVNANNLPAVKAYEKAGFVVRSEKK